MRIQAVRIESLYLRARSALAAAADPSSQSSIDRAALLRIALRDAQRLGREDAPWGRALSLLVLSGVAILRNQPDDCARRLTTAEAAFETLDMPLHAMAARFRRGELLGGAAGDALVQQADLWMAAQTIRNPGRMVDMLAPGPYRPR
jgi:hypothetical protein